MERDVREIETAVLTGGMERRKALTGTSEIIPGIQEGKEFGIK
jgi:hypothetical protein